MLTVNGASSQTGVQPSGSLEYQSIGGIAGDPLAIQIYADAGLTQLLNTIDDVFASDGSSDTVDPNTADAYGVSTFYVVLTDLSTGIQSNVVEVDLTGTLGAGTVTVQIPVSGSLVASGLSAAELAGFPISISVDGAVVSTLTTSSDGTFSGTVPYTLASQAVGESVTVVASFAGSNVGPYELEASSSTPFGYTT